MYLWFVSRERRDLLMGIFRSERMTFYKDMTKWFPYVYRSTVPWLMNNIPCPMETTSSIKKHTYIHLDSRKGGLYFLEIITVKWYKVQPDCRINQNTDLGNEHGRRDNQERMGPGMKVKRTVKRSLQHLKKRTEGESVSTESGPKGWREETAVL